MGKNIRQLAKISSLFPDEVFPDKKVAFSKRGGDDSGEGGEDGGGLWQMLKSHRSSSQRNQKARESLFITWSSHESMKVGFL